MDEQIAKMMFESVATEITDYLKAPTSENDLQEKLRKELGTFENVTFSEDGKGAIVDVIFYADKSKTRTN